MTTDTSNFDNLHDTVDKVLHHIPIAVLANIVILADKPVNAIKAQIKTNTGLVVPIGVLRCYCVESTAKAIYFERTGIESEPLSTCNY